MSIIIYFIYLFKFVYDYLDIDSLDLHENLDDLRSQTVIDNKNNTNTSCINIRTSTQIGILSLNTHSLSKNNYYVNYMTALYSIIFLSETMILSKEKANELIASTGKDIFIKEAIETSGRPSGGLMFIVDDNLSGRCIWANNRVGMLIIHKINTAVIGVYMTSYDGAESDIEYVTELAAIESCIREAKKDSINNIILLGDFNCELSKYRPSSTVHTYRKKKLNGMLKKMNLTRLDKLYMQFIQYTYYESTLRKNRHKKVKTWIDMIFFIGDLKIVNQCNIINKEHNNSDHLALDITINVEQILVPPKENKSYKICEYDWLDLDFRLLYNTKIDKLMQNINLDKVLNGQSNRTMLVTVLLNMINTASINAFNSCVNTFTVTRRYKKFNPWWDSDVIQKYKLYWNSYQKYLRVDTIENKLEKNRLFKEYKKQQSDNIKFIKEKTMHKIRIIFMTDRINGWRLIKKMGRNKNKIDVPIDAIKNQFDRQFSEKIMPESSLVESSRQKVEKFIDNYDYMNDFDLDTYEVKEIVNKLSNGKKAGFSGTTYEMFKYSENEKHISMLTLLLKIMIKEGVIPHLFNIAIVNPLIKDQDKGGRILTNLRPISISDAIPNIYESILLSRINRSVLESNQQFGFKSNSSCAHAIFCLNEVMSYCFRHNLKLYIVFIDASKAFDKVNRYILWSILIDVLPAYIVFSLIKYYEKSICILELYGTLSAIFMSILGVKQGGVLSPRLFSFYITPIIERLKRLGLGVKIGNMILESLLYADDLALLSLLKMELQMMLDVVGEYGIDYEIKYNPDKSQLMICNKNVKRQNSEQHENDIYIEYDLKLLGEVIPEVSEVTYLGVKITSQNLTSNHLGERIESAARAMQSLRHIGMYNRILNPITKATIYKCMVRPILLHGSEVVLYNKGHINKIQKAEATMLKKANGFSKYCKNSDLLNSMGIECSGTTIMIYKCKFFVRLTKNCYTRELIEQLLQDIGKAPSYYTSRSSLLHCIAKILHLEYDEVNKKYKESIHEIIVKCKKFVSMVKREFKQYVEEDEYMIELKRIMLINSTDMGFIINNKLQPFNLNAN
jgi:hypothetical protein